MQSEPAASTPSLSMWRSNALRPKWWFEKPWFVVGLIGLTGLVFMGVVRQHSFDAASSFSNNPNAVPFPTTSGDQGCQNFAQYWMEASNVNVPANVVKDISTCRQAADGSWFLPTGPDDARLVPGEAMTPAERVKTAQLRANILGQIAMLNDVMPGGLKDALTGIRTGEQRAVIEGIRRGAYTEPMRSTYARLVQAFLIAPSTRDLANYVGWRMKQRIDALNALVSTCKADPSNGYLFTACDTLADILDINYPPFIWQLFNPLTLDDYLAHVVRSGSPGAVSGSPMINGG